MSNLAIKVENISKQYRLGTVGTGSLAHDINRAWYKLRGQDDPYLKIGESNDRSKKGNSEYVWALKDINFELKHGEVLGIIGRNGAGKSTLLKILSRTTTPTTGSVKIKGRVASLLEVGTGFHPELSGRENIFLNGAILGMTKREIKRKFDEIVNFAEVERYIDTPVKRYSSGMYVRLAFGVAAHLDPEILIIDEVLAVGDAEFQKKALGKMKDVSGKEGRTVLFVSHNMLAVSNLCSSAILLNNGQLVFNGNINDAIQQYVSSGMNSTISAKWDLESAPGSNGIKLISAKIFSTIDSNKQKFRNADTLEVDVRFSIEMNKSFFATLVLKHITGDIVFETKSADIFSKHNDITVSYKIPPLILNANTYVVQINLITTNFEMIHFFEQVLVFEIEEEIVTEGFYYKTRGYLKPMVESIVVENYKEGINKF